MTGHHRGLYQPAIPCTYHTVPADDGGCDQLTCHDGPFLVVFMGIDMTEYVM